MWCIRYWEKGKNEAMYIPNLTKREAGIFKDLLIKDPYCRGFKLLNQHKEVW